MSRKETYYPKELTRIHPKLGSGPISLRTMAMDRVFKTLMESKCASFSRRNARDRKVLRQHLDEHLPALLQEEFFHYVVTRFISIKKLLNILSALEPKKMVTDRLDLIGSFRYAYGCYYTNGNLYWSNGTIERLNLSQEQCDRLYSYLLWSDAFTNKMLKVITISTQRNALVSSKLPSLLARSPNLTAVTILNGVTDHVLRIIGLNCPCLKLLDISHSSLVSNVGMKQLLVKNPRQSLGRFFDPEQVEKNPCAGTIFKFIFVGTNLTDRGIELACRLMGNNSTHICFLPEDMILRPTDGQVPVNSVTLDSPLALNALTLEEGVHQSINAIAVRWADRKRETGHRIQVLDVYTPPNSVQGESQIVLRSIKSPHCEAMMTTRKLNDKLLITQLILCWDSFTWNVAVLPVVTELALALPHLEVLKARIQGIWEREGEPLFPKLKDTFLWSVSDSTMMSFLTHCPSIEIFKFNCLNLMAVPLSQIVTDQRFQTTLLGNPSLCSTITELCLRPAPRLTIETAKVVIEKCPKLRRLGDMESWAVSNEDIAELNTVLDSKNSPAVLTVFSFPPMERHTYLV